jgi:ankyrin repeat protein
MFNPSPDFEHIRLSEELFQAAKAGCENILRDLLHSGADPNQPIDSDGTTILMEVSELGDLSIVKILVEAGANVQAKSHSNDTALQYAASKGFTEIVDYLLPFSTKADQNKAKKLLKALQGKADNLVVAAGAGNLDEVRDLIDSGVDINTLGIERHNALYAASARGQNRVVQLLIDLGANLDTSGEVSNTPLLEAISHYELNIISLLLKAGANPNQPDFGNCITPLISAVLRELDDPWITRKLISAGANINQKNRFGSTAIMAAALSNNIRTLKSSPFCSESVTMRLLFENGASNEGINEMELIAAVQLGNGEMVSALLGKKLNLDLMSNYGYSALMYAAKEGHKTIVNMLINAGATVDLVGRETALICAIMRRDREIVELLLKSGANLNLRNAYGDSPMYYAKQVKDSIYRMLRHFPPCSSNLGGDNDSNV